MFHEQQQRRRRQKKTLHFAHLCDRPFVEIGVWNRMYAINPETAKVLQKFCMCRRNTCYQSSSANIFCSKSQQGFRNLVTLYMLLTVNIPQAKLPSTVSHYSESRSPFAKQLMGPTESSVSILSMISDSFRGFHIATLYSTAEHSLRLRRSDHRLSEIQQGQVITGTRAWLLLER